MIFLSFGWIIWCIRILISFFYNQKSFFLFKMAKWYHNNVIRILNHSVTYRAYFLHNIHTGRFTSNGLLTPPKFEWFNSIFSNFSSRWEFSKAMSHFFKLNMGVQIWWIWCISVDFQKFGYHIGFLTAIIWFWQSAKSAF